MIDKSKEIAEVIPAVKLPRDLTQFFSYRIPEDMRKDIHVGDVVRIPFRRQEVLGVVQNFTAEKEEGFKIKDILEIVSAVRLSENQLQLARFLAAYYFTPLSLVIKTMLPEITKREARTPIKLSPAPETIPLPEKIAAATVEAIGRSDRTLLLHSWGAPRHELYRQLIEKQAKKSQVLLLLPEYFDVFSSAQSYVDRFGPAAVAILAGDLTPNQYYAEWQKVKSGCARVVIGTRQAVFAPFVKLELVIVDEEHNSSYKQWDQNPRYHAVTAAIELAKLADARIVLSSPTPSLESYYRTQKDFSLLDVAQSPQSYPLLIDMDTERKQGNYTFISERLQAELLQEIYAKKQALVFIPRLGEKTIHQCKDCGHIAECAVCQSPLIGYKNKLYCSRCKQLYEVMASCPQCHGQNISAFGGGSQRVFEELENLFAGKNIKIKQLDSSTSEDSKRNAKIYADFQAGRIDILVGTQMVWKNWQMPDLSVIAVIFPEIIFSAPGFRSREKAWQFLQQVYAFAEEKTVLIQSRKVEHKYFIDQKKSTGAEFLEKELESRRESLSSFLYPPCGRFLKLIYKHSDARIAEQEAKWQYEILQREMFDRHLRDQFEVMPPFAAQSFREYGKYRYHLILKHRSDLDLGIRDSLLSCVKKDWIVDVDPDEIL